MCEVPTGTVLYGHMATEHANKESDGQWSCVLVLVGACFFKQRWPFFGAPLVPVGGEIEKGGLCFCCFVQGVAEFGILGGGMPRFPGFASAARFQ